MVLSFSSSVTLRDAGKTFCRAVESGETPEHFIRVLPPERFKQSLRSSSPHVFTIGERVVLLSFTAAGWIYSGFHGTIVSLQSELDSRGRKVQKAHVEWDAGLRHPARISVHAVSRLRLVQ